MSNVTSTRRYEQIAIGDELPPLVKRITPQHMMAYGAATWDFIRLHYDADQVRAKGFPAPFVDGQMFGGYLAQIVQDWAGPDARLRRLSFRNKVMTYPGDTIAVQGVVVDKAEENGERLVTCDLWIDNQRGEQVVRPAQVVVALPA